MVTMSQPTPARSPSASATSPAVSPRPTMIEDLVTSPLSLALASTPRLRA